MRGREHRRTRKNRYFRAPIHMKCPERANLQRQEVDGGCQGCRDRKARAAAEWVRSFIRTNENVPESRQRWWWLPNFVIAPNAPGLFTPWNGYFTLFYSVWILPQKSGLRALLEIISRWEDGIPCFHYWINKESISFASCMLHFHQ